MHQTKNYYLLRSPFAKGFPACSTRHLSTNKSLNTLCETHLNIKVKNKQVFSSNLKKPSKAYSCLFREVLDCSQSILNRNLCKASNLKPKDFVT